MSTTHLFTSPAGLVLKSLRGAAALNPTLFLHEPSKSVYVHPPSPTARVAVLAGGGAGHEPAHASYTARGMLAASVSGDIFASPSARHILDTIVLAAFPTPTTTTPRPVLVIINNYTGDLLNFGLALEHARARFPTLELASIIVADDVSLLHAPSLVGPRGLAGNILVCKILGALAERGASLAALVRTGEAVVAHLASVGVGLAHCHVPGRAAPDASEAIGEGECEIGLGLHNEPGVRRVRVASAGAVVGEMVGMVVGAWGWDVGDAEEREVVLLVNNLGGMSGLEMGAIVDEVRVCLERTRVRPVRVYAGAYMTSLNAPGFSISLIDVRAVRVALASSPPFNEGDTIADVLALLDDPTDAPAWARVRGPAPGQNAREVTALLNLVDTESVDAQGDDDEDAAALAVERGIRAACEHVLNAGEAMTRFDTVLGDGDCGDTFAAGAHAVLRALDSGAVRMGKRAVLVRELGAVLEGENGMGGTVGALFAIFFTAWATALTETPRSPAQALQHALGALLRYTPAREGDRTLVDALAPFVRALAGERASESALDGGLLGRMGVAVLAARAGALGTRGMRPRLGRAVYVAGGLEGGELPPDPGAWGVAALVEGFWEGMRGA